MWLGNLPSAAVHAAVDQEPVEGIQARVTEYQVSVFPDEILYGTRPGVAADARTFTVTINWWGRDRWGIREGPFPGHGAILRRYEASHLLG
jgi:hypothetical protein